MAFSWSSPSVKLLSRVLDVGSDMCLMHCYFPLGVYLLSLHDFLQKFKCLIGFGLSV